MEVAYQIVTVVVNENTCPTTPSNSPDTQSLHRTLMVVMSGS